MDISQLKYCVEADKYHSFSKAAEACYVTQSVISVQIRKLEREYGITIFTRSSNGVVPTIEGEQFLVYARQILETESQLQQEMKKIKESGTLKLSIGLARCSAIFHLTDRVAAFKRDYPRIDINLKEGNSDNLIELLRMNVLDAAFLSAVSKPKDLPSYELMQDDIVLAAAPSSPLAGRSRIDIRELRGETLIFSDNSSIYRAARTMSAQLGDKVEDYFDFYETHNGHIFTNLSLVSNGLGCTLVTRKSAQEYPGHVAIIELIPPMKHYIYLATSKNPDNQKLKNSFVKFNQHYNSVHNSDLMI